VSVKIRLQRVGTKKKPYYRVVVMDERTRRDGMAIENLGQYQPIAAEKQFTVNEEKVIGWLKKGAVPTDTMTRLLKKAGVWQKFKNA
jgi:small subunit ribosomal protein S16